MSSGVVSAGVVSARIVSIRLWGGLCNRLFQIAAVLNYAQRYGLNPIFYNSLMDNNAHLDNLETCKILIEMIPSICISSDYHLTESQCELLEYSGDDACRFIELPSPDMTSSKPILLKGYFQSEKYFQNLNPPFLAEFINQIKISQIDNNTSARITKKYFIHIRLGDYKGHYLHYLGYKNYLNNSIKYILEREKEKALLESNIEFIILSNSKDDNEIRTELHNVDIFQHIKWSINHNLSVIETLKYMAICDGGICMNSSFSWFGAYLCKMMGKQINKDRIITMPNKWFNEQFIPKERYKDIYPSWNNLVIIDI